MTEPTGKPPHRTRQDERSALMRTKLLDATIECLADKGYCRTTTTDIAARAGVSRGAQLHHFPTKIELVTAAVRHLAEKRLGHLRNKAQYLEGKSDRISAAIDLLWSVVCGHWFNVAVELWIEARTDPALSAAVYPVEQEMAKEFEAVWRELFGESSSTLRSRNAMGLTLYTMRGMALEGVLKKDDRRRRALLEEWKNLLPYLLGNGAQHSPLEHAGRPAASDQQSNAESLKMAAHEPK